MPIRIYNTLTRKKEIFEPVEPGKIKMYVCGPTVYDSCHIGHARSVVIFDVITRYFRQKGYEVLYVRNFTDIDDKIINRANETSTDTVSLSQRYIHEFYADMDALNVQRATFEPKATEHVDDIIRVIEALFKRDLAYQIDGDVFFPVEKFFSYGKLSGRKLEDMMAGARVDVDDRKHNPFDFVLWKSAKPGEPFWKSPWGDGRPGWHIECSAMSSRFLGETFDIHGGGQDLIFPHHENEIAQSEGAFGKPFARFWIHNGFVNIEKEKMSKSLGNFLLIKDVIKSFHPETVRLFLLSSHYRSPIDFNQKAMEETGAGLDKIYSLLDRIGEKLGKYEGRTIENKDNYWSLFCEAMDDDFNTAKGIGVLFDAVRGINKILDDCREELTPAVEAKVRSGWSEILNIGETLGIMSCMPEVYFEQKKSMFLNKSSLDADEIIRLINERADARKSKQWERADKIRKQLADMNVVLEDRPEGTIWKITN
jgi:cysteinyl-tRNA synthetase